MATVAQDQDFGRQLSRFDLSNGGGQDDEGTDESGADGPCYSSDPVRFADCGNGTITDQVTALTWLADATCLSLAYYAEANEIAASLGEGTHPDCELTDGSSPVIKALRVSLVPRKRPIVDSNSPSVISLLDPAKPASTTEDDSLSGLIRDTRTMADAFSNNENIAP